MLGLWVLGLRDLDLMLDLWMLTEYISNTSGKIEPFSEREELYNKSHTHYEIFKFRMKGKLCSLVGGSDER